MDDEIISVVAATSIGPDGEEGVVVTFNLRGGQAKKLWVAAEDWKVVTEAAVLEDYEPWIMLRVLLEKGRPMWT